MTMYGLPEEVKFCKRCTISNQRPNSCVEHNNTPNSKKETIHFDEEGVCSACRVAEQKETIDWDARDAELRALCDKHRRSDAGYDCIVPGSGGKDSFKQTWLLRYVYGMNPLTVTWAPNLYTEWGRRNHKAWIDSGFDNILVTPAGNIHAILTRLSIEKLFHPFQPFILGQKMLAPMMAAKFGIKLIFYGENEAEYGNPRADLTTALRDASYYTEANDSDVFLSGISLSELSDSYGVDRKHLNFYLPPPPESVKGIEVHYLGYYMPWSPLTSYNFVASMAAVSGIDWGIAEERTAGTFTDWNSIDDMIDDLHYWTTYIKFGIGRATYDSCQAIRNGEMTRKDAVKKVRQYDGEFPNRFMDEICRHLTISSVLNPEVEAAFTSRGIPLEFSKTRLLWLADKFRPPHLWEPSAAGVFVLAHTVK